MNKKGFSRTLTMLLVFTMLLGMAPGALAAKEAETAQETLGTGVLSSSAYLYEEPGAKAAKVLSSRISKGKSVTLLDTAANSGWYKVVYNENEGYIQSKYIKIDEEKADAAPAATGVAGYTTQATRFRKTASSSGSSLGTIKEYVAVTVLDSTSNKNWWKVSYNNKEGYLSTKHVALGEADAAALSVVAASGKDVNASKIASAKSKNKDVVGWLNIPNTNMDEPILYAPNWYYANRNINKSKSYDSVYPHTSRLTKNLVLYGHNLRGSNACTHQLHHLQEAALGYSRCQSGACGRSFSSGLGSWYKNTDGRVWNISIFGTQKWEVFAMYEVSKNEPKTTLRNNWNTSPTNMDSWIKGQLRRSEIDFGVSVSAKDKIMTIITCGTNYDSATANSRLFVFLKNVD